MYANIRDCHRAQPGYLHYPLLYDKINAMIYTSTSEKQTEQIAADFAKSLAVGDVVALFGNLGAGKTAFVRGMAAGLGYTGTVTSPTFNLLHQYDGTVRLSHYDLYRINGADDLEELGYYDLLDTDILAIEWSERIHKVLPKNAKRVTLTRIDDMTREIEIC